jgi:hypothetical protein
MVTQTAKGNCYGFSMGIYFGDVHMWPNAGMLLMCKYIHVMEYDN